MFSEQGIQLSIVESVARITLSRPARRNALDGSAWRSLADICTQLAARADVRAVVLTGEGSHFCAGADIHELRAHISDADWMLQNQTDIANALDLYANLPQPTLALLRGSCYGGGAALAVSSDFRFATADTKIAITPTKLGLTYRLVDCLRIHQLVGPARTREMLLLAREVDAVTALDWALINEICEDNMLEHRTSGWVSSICSFSGYSQRGIKKTLLKIAAGQTEDDTETRKIFQDAFQGSDFLHAADAFTQK
jgi:enoyl-CoA hydratase